MGCDKCVQAQVVEQLPDHVDVGKENRSICVDPCLRAALLVMWMDGIDTRGHCCGHGKTRASIIVSEDTTPAEIRAAKDIMEKMFDGQFDILQWKLCSV